MCLFERRLKCQDIEFILQEKLHQQKLEKKGEINIDILTILLSFNAFCLNDMWNKKIT